MKSSLTIVAAFAMVLFFAHGANAQQWPFGRRPTPTPAPLRRVSPSAKPLRAVPVRAATPTPIPVALPNYDEQTTTRLQIFLDNNYFGPGKIDGRMGEFFRKALLAYKRAHLMPLLGTVDQWLLDQVPEPFTNYTIPPEAENFVGPTASKPSEQAALHAKPDAGLIHRLLQILDLLWKDHIDALDVMREGIPFRLIGQHDPLVEFRNEASNKFESLKHSIQQYTVDRILRARIELRRRTGRRPQE